MSKSVRFWWNLVRFFRNLISHNLVMVPGAKLLKNEGKWWKQKWQKWKNVGFWWKLIFPKKVRPPDFKKIGPRAKYPQKWWKIKKNNPKTYNNSDLSQKSKNQFFRLFTKKTIFQKKDKNPKLYFSKLW